VHKSLIDGEERAVEESFSAAGPSRRTIAGMHRTLIVARLKPGHNAQVADAFAESDSTELPRLVGVASRSLFSFHDLYFHLIESEVDLRPALGAVRDHPLFTGLSDRLSEFVTAYDPGWRGPQDAMAHEFYRWSR
jgi:cyclase